MILVYWENTQSNLFGSGFISFIYMIGFELTTHEISQNAQCLIKHDETAAIVFIYNYHVVCIQKLTDAFGCSQQ